MRRLVTAAVFFLAAFGCSSEPPLVDATCTSTQTCSETVCPELCGDSGEVTIANCFHPPWSGADDPGDCNCRCEYEDARPTCFASGQEGHGFPRLIVTDTVCVDGRGSWDECGAACEAACVWGFPPIELRCPVSGGTTVHCQCLCESCEFTG